MIDLGTVVSLVAAHPYAVLFPLAVIEGPIVTVVAASLLHDNPVALATAFVIVVIADLVGDAGLYFIGRRAHSMSERWQRRLGLTSGRLEKLEGHFRERGGSTLAIGKLTHSVGFAVLLAAGASRMGFGRFLGWNFIATVPKVIVLMIIGVLFGSALGAVDLWIGKVTLILAVVLVVAGLAWWIARKRNTPCPDN